MDSLNSTDLFSLRGRTAVITGAAGMLGRRYSEAFARYGASVALVDIDGERARRCAATVGAQTGSRCIGIETDISSKSSVAGMVSDVIGEFGAIDILVNNAAIDPKFEAGTSCRDGPSFEDFPLELWQKTLDVNLTGTFLCCQAVGREMAARKSGSVINISSTYGLVAPDQRIYHKDDASTPAFCKPAAYTVTKAAVIQLTRYLATYWGDKGIRVNALVPGGVYNSHDEEFIRKYSERTPLGRMATKDEMTGALIFLASDASSYMTGACLVVDGGWTAW
jgi:NAD(P)-dependent dehydrogenase (short-subunit alcohol dehydrogenase family)